MQEEEQNWQDIKCYFVTLLSPDIADNEAEEVKIVSDMAVGMATAIFGDEIMGADWKKSPVIRLGSLKVTPLTGYSVMKHTWSYVCRIEYSWRS